MPNSLNLRPEFRGNAAAEVSHRNLKNDVAEPKSILTPLPQSSIVLHTFWACFDSISTLTSI